MKFCKNDVEREQIDKFEPRFIIKLLFIKGLRSKAIRTELETALDAAAYSLTQAKKSVGQLRTCHFACQ
jgi:hypothetical protein